MSEAMREAFEAVERIGNYASVPFEMMTQFADDVDTIKAALQSQTAPAVPDGVDVTAFGSGDYTVEVGGYVDQHAVFIAPANPAGKVGDLAQPTTGEDKHRLAPGERVLTFPTETQAFAVAEALAGRRINRLDGSSPTPQPDHSPDAGKVEESGQLIHVGYTNPAQIEYAKDESGSFYPDTDHQCHIPIYMLKRHLNRMGHDYTRPAESREEIQAQALEAYADQLDVVFANAQRAGANDCPAWHAGQFAKDARKQAARLRASQQEGGE